MYKIKIDDVLTGIFGMIIFICLALITKDMINYKKADNEYDRLKKYISDETETETVNADETGNPYIPQYPDNIESDASEWNAEGLAADYDKLYEINNDLVCILSIPSLDLKYPVVQGSDNVKYLNTTFEGNKNPAGCLFIDYENSRDMTDPHTYIYGHNMKDGSMFGSLKRIMKNDKDKKDIKAYITTERGKYAYDLEKAEVVNIDEYRASDKADDLLTLYTCWGNDKNKRLLVTFAREKSNFDHIM